MNDDRASNMAPGPGPAPPDRTAVYSEERSYWLRQVDGHFDEADLPFIRWHQQQVIEAFAIPATEAVAEVGCGHGKLFKDRSRVLLIDFSPEILARARQLYPHMLAVCASVDALPFLDSSLANIAANNMLHHVKGEGLLEPTLDELHRVLTADGQLYVNDRNPVLVHHVILLVTMATKRLLRRLFGEFGGCGSYNEPLFTTRDWANIEKRFAIISDRQYYTAAMWLVDSIAKGLYVVLRRRDREFVARIQRRALPWLLWIERHARHRRWCIERAVVATRRR